MNKESFLQALLLQLTQGMVYVSDNVADTLKDQTHENVEQSSEGLSPNTRGELDHN